MSFSNKENTIILWLSDIHYKCYDEEKYGELKKKQKQFIDAFLGEVEIILKEKKRIDYIVLSGDIAFSGDEKAYKQFWTDFIDPFYELVHTANVYPKILTIPGNHDVNWDDAGFMSEYLQHSSQDQKNSFLLRRTANFEKLFAHYSASFSNESIEKGRKSFRLLTLEKENTVINGMNNPYPDKRLFGFFIDKPNNILFILINTAWYSLGSKFDKVIAEHYLNNTKYNEAPALLIERILETKNQLIEYNGQIFGRDLLRGLDLIDFLDKNPGLFVVTCMHHPRNWMAWDEIYSIKESGLTINKLLERTNVLLSGHEHVPESVLPEIINETIHYKAGVFLEDNINKEDEKIFLHNRFSVLEVGNVFSHPYIREIRYLYDNVKWKWEKGDEGSPKHFRQRSIKRNIPVSSELGSKLNNFRLNDYIFDELLHQKRSINRTKEDKPRKGTLTISGYKCKYVVASINSTNRIYICPTEFKNPFLTTISEHPDELIKALKKAHYDNGISVFCAFLVPDVLVNWHIAQGYNGNTYEEVLNELTKHGDAQFNKFRDAFFSHFQYSDKDFKSVMNIRFVNHIIPYWKLEQYS